MGELSTKLGGKEFDWQGRNNEKWRNGSGSGRWWKLDFVNKTGNRGILILNLRNKFSVINWVTALL